LTLDDLLKIPSRPPQGDDKPPTIGQRLAELVYKNEGRIEITSWGVIEIGGLYGELGLHQNEAFELLYLSGLIRGFGIATDDIATTDRRTIEWIRLEWERIEATLVQRAE
jgi:hypothetical protein